MLQHRRGLESSKSSKDNINSSLINPSNEITNKNITESILRVADLCIPKKKARTKKTVPYWNDECKQAVRDKRKAKKK